MAELCLLFPSCTVHINPKSAVSGWGGGEDGGLTDVRALIVCLTTLWYVYDIGSVDFHCSSRASNICKRTVFIYTAYNYASLG
jgi:hypothetical protein